MSLDLTTLGLLKQRDRYERLFKVIPERALETRTRFILTDFGRYFREHDSATQVHHESFMMLFKSIHPKVSDEDMAVYTQLIGKALTEQVNPELELGIMKRLHATAAAYDTGLLITRFNDGEEVDLRVELQAIQDRYDEAVDRKIKDPQVRNDIEDLLKDEENEVGFHWRMPCIARCVKPAVPGDFIVMAARPDKGKTSWCASELTYMAAQIDSIFPGENRSILWLNNEGPGKRIVTRTYQAALGLTMEELVKLSNTPPDPEWNKAHGVEYRSRLRQLYTDAIGGRAGALRIMDIHDWWSHEVEDLFRLRKPAIVLFDMVDNIKFGGNVGNNGQRTDQLLEAMYQWARLMAVKHDFIAIATSQISADGDGLNYPTLSMLKDSKTGKQGAADVIITMGALNDPMMENTRFMGCTKNKKQRTGQPKTPLKDVIFHSDRCTYSEVQS